MNNENTEQLDRLPFPDCALPGCDGYAEDNEKYCELCLEALRASVEEAMRIGWRRCGNSFVRTVYSEDSE